MMYKVVYLVIICLFFIPVNISATWNPVELLVPCGHECSLGDAYCDETGRFSKICGDYDEFNHRDWDSCLDIPKDKANWEECEYRCVNGICQDNPCDYYSCRPGERTCHLVPQTGATVYGSVECVFKDGCWQWSDEYDVCEYGCNVHNGACKSYTQDSKSECNWDQWKCQGDYRMPCNDNDMDGIFSFDKDPMNWDGPCKHGCMNGHCKILNEDGEAVSHEGKGGVECIYGRRRCNPFNLDYIQPCTQDNKWANVLEYKVMGGSSTAIYDSGDQYAVCEFGCHIDHCNPSPEQEQQIKDGVKCVIGNSKCGDKQNYLLTCVQNEFGNPTWQETRCPGKCSRSGPDTASCVASTTRGYDVNINVTSYENITHISATTVGEYIYYMFKTDTHPNTMVVLVHSGDDYFSVYYPPLADSDDVMSDMYYKDGFIWVVYNDLDDQWSEVRKYTSDFSKLVNKSQQFNSQYFNGIIVSDLYTMLLTHNNSNVPDGEIRIWAVSPDAPPNLGNPSFTYCMIGDVNLCFANQTNIGFDEDDDYIYVLKCNHYDYTNELDCTGTPRNHYYCSHPYDFEVEVYESGLGDNGGGLVKTIQLRDGYYYHDVIKYNDKVYAIRTDYVSKQDCGDGVNSYNIYDYIFNEIMLDVSTCFSECENGSRKCVGAMNDMYVECIEVNDGCWQWYSADKFTYLDQEENMEICPSGCESFWINHKIRSATCKDGSACTGICTEGETKCTADKRFVMDCVYRGPPLLNPLVPSLNFGTEYWCWQWNLMQEWERCPLGSECQNGACVAVDACSKTKDQRCWYDAEGKFNTEKYSYIINCNQEKGMMLFNIYNHSYCKWGCVDDFNTTTNTYVAECINMSSEVIEARNIASDISSAFNVMVPIQFRFVFLIILSVIGSIIVTAYSKSSKFGLIGGIAVFGIGIIYSWVPLYVSVFIALLLGFYVFKRFLSESEY